MEIFRKHGPGEYSICYFCCRRSDKFVVRRDFEFEIQPAAYEGDGTRVLKLVFDDIGEIDFIVAQTLTSSPTTPTVVEGEAILLETIPEIITKKIYYRAASIKPRDIFDIAAAGEQHRDPVIKELRKYRDQVTRAR